MQAKIKCCISQVARWNLTKLKEKKQRASMEEYELDQALGLTVEFTDACIEHDHPSIEPFILRALYAIDRNIVLCWELQAYFEHRWHVKWWDERDREEKNILLLQYPHAPLSAMVEAEYVPMDERALRDVRRLMHQLRHGLQREATKAHLESIEAARLRKECEMQQLAADRDKEERHILERLRGDRNISDPGWERGIGFDKDGKPFTEGKGAHVAEHTRAI